MPFRIFLFALAMLFAVQAISLQAREPFSGFATIVEKAERLAGRPFEPAPNLPKQLETLDYDSYRLIAFEHREAIWKARNRPFWLELFHRGYLFRDKVTIHLIESGYSTSLEYDRRFFQYRGDLSELRVPDDIGFAGFRVLGKFESSTHLLEIASFLGASYYRAIAPGQVYGTSARGLAINAGMSQPEEFPLFREFWVQAPEVKDHELTFWALLDSQSVAGAYQFVFKPGEATSFDVTAQLFFRHQPEKVCLAPLTSMWMWGDGRPGPENDPRRKVHDAEGLLVHTTDEEWIWRPLGRYEDPSLSQFDFAGIRGFGLIQRDRWPTNYRDDEAKYHLRPSVWIEPKKDWGRGTMELLELPAKHEGIDNIATWWVPGKHIDTKRPLELTYRISFRAEEPINDGLARAVATRVHRQVDKPVEVEVDFAGEMLEKLPSAASLRASVDALRGEARNVRIKKQADNLWRLRFEVIPSGREGVELKAVVRQGETPVTETWRYLCLP